jgi:hypothetical protein
MSDLLAIFGAPEEDAHLLERIAAFHPTRITVLADGADAERLDEDSSAGVALRDRLAGLMAAIERETGATVVGLAGGRAQLLGWRFDRELVAPEPVARERVTA